MREPWEVEPAFLILTSPSQLSSNYLFIHWNLLHLCLEQHPKISFCTSGHLQHPIPSGMLQHSQGADVQMLEGTALGLWSTLGFCHPFPWVQTPSPWL